MEKCYNTCKRLHKLVISMCITSNCTIIIIQYQFNPSTLNFCIATLPYLCKPSTHQTLTNHCETVQTLAFCTRAWLCKTTITKHLITYSNCAMLGYRSMTVANAILAHKTCCKITALEIHYVVQLTLSSANYMS